MKAIVVIFSLFVSSLNLAQDYTEFLTGNPNDVTVNPNFGICLMGGATENDNAMTWFLNKANGGDVVVLRATGSDTYNDYFYSQLGVTLNSVRTFVIASAEGATHPYVLDKINKAEAIWIAGGNQLNYISFFKDNAMEDALNNFINNKGGVIGGTSAGMAILGSAYFTAENGTVLNEDALQNPYAPEVTLGYNDFLNIPFLNQTITDTHYDNPIRNSRHSVFLARYASDNNSIVFGLACEEFTAVCIDDEGRAFVFGDYPSFNDFAYFIQTNCTNEFLPETCLPNQPLTWNRNNEALKVYKIPGTANGENYFELSTWQVGTGGVWQNWYVDNGVFYNNDAAQPNCFNLSGSEISWKQVSIFPNPSSEVIFIESLPLVAKVEIFDLQGKAYDFTLLDNAINITQLNSGFYLLKISDWKRTKVFKFLKK